MVDLQTMTVVALRQFAKEHKITLGTGISKAEMIRKIQSAISDSDEAPSLPVKTIEAPPTFAAPLTEPKPEAKAPIVKPGPHNDIVYSTKPAWQARSTPPRSPRAQDDTRRTASQNNYTNRFGPSASATASRFGPAASQAPSPVQTSPKEGAPGAHFIDNSGPPSPKKGRQDPLPSSPPKTVTGPVPSFSELTVSELLGDGKGVLEVLPDGFGFLRDDTFSSSPKDIYVSNAQIKRFALRTGDQIEGRVRLQKDGERYSALLYIISINGQPAQEQEPSNFNDLTPVYPNRFLPMKESLVSSFEQNFSLSSFFAPIGYGQRSLLVVDRNLTSCSLIGEFMSMLALEEESNTVVLGVCFNRSPEDITECKKQFTGETFISTFTQTPDVHIRMSELALGRAQRLAEKGKDVIMLVDNLGALTTAYQALSLQNIRGSANALSPSALSRTLHFFGAARNSIEGGSLTIIASFSHTHSDLDKALAKELVFASNNCLFADYAYEDNFFTFDLMKSFTKRKELIFDEKALKLNRALIAKANTLTPEEFSAALEEIAAASSSVKQMRQKLTAWAK